MIRYQCVLRAPFLLLALVAPVAAAPQDGLQRLAAGNQRWVSGATTHPDQTAARRTEVASGQKPFAVIVSCSDSRVPPELIFDQGVGDLFVVRAAGEVVDAVALGSIEFAVTALGAPLVVVLGHERCGAVEAALGGTATASNIGSLVGAITPNINRADGVTPATLDTAVRDQVQAVVRQLRAAGPLLAPRVQDGSLHIVGAVYDLDTGQVTALDPLEVRP
jgi:carbonic anhydrase